ncbi:MAG TPA: 30S ribosomal protein S19 [Candidatus Aenigmarchaeota archaeon]|nr:MAG: 30S ribosomal protein S19 [Candidatus Aenigmarchaeota archaeon]HDD46077.1 30S ribosomal protein S19 [Candidatus Aenigmarchaeota archaeon]
MAKFVFYGKTIEEVKKMSLEEFSSLLTSRERRSLKRGLTEREEKLLEKIRKHPDKFHRTHERQMVILPEMIGAKIGVHNGKEYVPLEIKPEMLGHRLGEFVPTRKQVKHSAPGFGATRSSKFIPLK